MASLPLVVAARLPRWNVRWPLAIRYLQPQPTSRAQAKETNSQNGSSDETFSRNCQYHSTRKFKIPLSPLDSPALPSQITGCCSFSQFRPHVPEQAEKSRTQEGTLELSCLFLPTVLHEWPWSPAGASPAQVVTSHPCPLSPCSLASSEALQRRAN